MTLAQLVAIVAGLGLLLVSGAVAYAMTLRARSRARLWQDAVPAGSSGSQSLTGIGRLAQWLGAAGFRDSGAPARFLLACGVCGAVALVVLAVMKDGQPLLALADALSAAPVIGLPAARLVLVLPWLVAVLLIAFPWLWVGSRRASRLAAIEQDLPLTLELLATLAESGLGFDASLDRVLESGSDERPLAVELRLYQAEVLGGGSRVECLRRFAGRVDQVTVTSTVAALVQAEEMGSSLAEVLRPLADDFRLRRRERALAKAEALPEKLVFPLVLGFLPSLLVWTLGPSFFQLFTAVDALMRGAN